MTKREWVRGALIAAIPVFYFPLSEWVCTARHGTSLLIWGQLVFSLLALVSLLAIPVFLAMLFSRRRRVIAAQQLGWTLILLPSTMLGTVWGLQVRTAGMERLARESRPLIAAIRQFETDRGEFPRSLSELVPQYLPAVPGTGMRAYPEFIYEVGTAESPSRFENPWILRVRTPHAGINFDEMIFLPEGDYPQRDDGGWYQRIGDWAYYHE